MGTKNDSEFNEMIPFEVSDWATYNKNYQAILSSFGINKLSNRDVIDSYIDETVRPQMSYHNSVPGQ